MGPGRQDRSLPFRRLQQLFVEVPLFLQEHDSATEIINGLADLFDLARSYLWGVSPRAFPRETLTHHLAGGGDDDQYDDELEHAHCRSPR